MKQKNINSNSCKNAAYFVLASMPVLLALFFPEEITAISPHLENVVWILVLLSFILIIALLVRDWSAMWRAIVAPLIGKELECLLTLRIDLEGQAELKSQLLSTISEICQKLGHTIHQHENDSLTIENASSELVDVFSALDKPEGVYARIEILDNTVRLTKKK